MQNEIDQTGTQIKPHTIELNRHQLDDQIELLLYAEQGIKARVHELVDDNGFEDLADALKERTDSGLDELGIDETDLEELRNLAALQDRIPEIQTILKAESERCDRCGETDDLGYETVETATVCLCDKCSLEIEKH
jgi:hypothetical protein